MQIQNVTEVTRGLGRLFAADRTCKKDSLDGVEVSVLPRAQVTAKLIAEQVMIHEGFVSLADEVRLDHLFEEFGVAAAEEEMQLVTGIFGIFFLFFFGLESCPIDEETEFCKGRVGIERCEVIVDFRQVFVGLNFCGSHIVDFELLAFLQHSCLLLFGEMSFWVKSGGQPQISHLGAPLGQCELAIDGILRVHGKYVQELAVTQILSVDAYDAVLVRDQVVENGRTFG